MTEVLFCAIIYVNDTVQLIVALGLVLNPEMSENDRTVVVQCRSTELMREPMDVAFEAVFTKEVTGYVICS